jgi:hypothetical protein
MIGTRPDKTSKRLFDVSKQQEILEYMIAGG